MPDFEIVVSGLTWMGGGVGSIESAIEEILSKTKREILMTAYSIGKAERVFHLLHMALARGVVVHIVINRFEKQHGSVRRRLENLQKTFPHLYLYSFQPDNERGDLHAKILISDRTVAIIGSSNLSYSGMVVNHELAVLITGEKVEDVVRCVETLIFHCSLK